MWKLPDESIIISPKDIQVGDTKYSKQIFSRWSVTELNAIGVYPFSEETYNSNYYQSTGFTDNEVNGEITRTHTLQPSMTLNQLKKRLAFELKETAKDYLLRLRNNLEYLTEFDPSNTEEVTAWNDFKTALKGAYQTIQAEVTAITDFDEMVDYIESGWSIHLPTAPDEDV